MSDIDFDKFDDEDLFEYEQEEQQIQVTPIDEPIEEELEKLDVSFDMEPADVLSYSNRGIDLFWHLDSFKELPESVVRELSPVNRQRYMLAYGEWKFESDHASDPEPVIEVSGMMAEATERLAVRNKDPKKSYSWQPPDKVRTMTYRGYKVSTDPKLDTFHRTKQGTHEVGIQGNTEFVLMETPIENFDRIQRAISEKSRNRADNVEVNTQKDIVKGKGIAYDPSKETKAKAASRNFS